MASIIQVQSEPINTEEQFLYTEGGNALRLLAAHRQDIRYCEKKRSWYVWNGAHWEKQDEGLAVVSRMKAVMKKMREAAQDILKVKSEQAEQLRSTKFTKKGELKDGSSPLTDQEEKLLQMYAKANDDYQWAVTSDSKNILYHSVDLAKDEEGVSVQPWDFDSNLNLFNCQNGTINVRTGEFFSHRREDMNSRIAPVTYDHEAECPLFEETLKLMYGDEPDGDEYIRYLQDFFGLALTGRITRDVLLLLGGGHNGKSTLVLAIAKGVLGSVYQYGYAAEADAATFVLSKWGKGSGGNARSDIAALDGARLIHSAEYTKSFVLDMAMLKALTGGEGRSGRDLYAKQTSFQPQASIIILTNEKPIVSDDTEGTWDRLKEVQSTADIPDKLREMGRSPQDDYYKILVQEEASGILNWMLKGAERCFGREALGQQLLVAPERIKRDTEAYRTDSSRIAEFVLCRCTLSPGATMERSQLYEQYKIECREAQETPESQKRFAELLQRDFPQLAPPNGEPLLDHRTRRAIWKGIRLKTDKQEPEESEVKKPTQLF
jgi:putative DNA primase/helicase